MITNAVDYDSITKSAQLSDEQLSSLRSCDSEWLIISHAEPELIDSMQVMLAKLSAKLLPLPMHEWRSESCGLNRVVDCIVRNTSVRNLALVGHSCASSKPLDPSTGFAKATSRNLRSHAVPEGLIGHVWQSQQRLKSAQAELSDHVHRLQSNFNSTNGAINHRLHVCGLLYVAESGLFHAYDSSAGSFHPLVNGASLA